jgi:hypothetical protein
VTWRELILGDDPWALAEALGELVGPVTNVEGLYFCCRAQLPAWTGRDHWTYWSEGTWFTWVKNRAGEVDALRATASGDGPPEARITTTLHVGFVTVVETEAQLAALRREPPPYKPREPEVARSKLGRTNYEVRPINRVASRVAPPPHHPEESPP